MFRETAASRVELEDLALHRKPDRDATRLHRLGRGRAPAQQAGEPDRSESRPVTSRWHGFRTHKRRHERAGAPRNPRDPRPRCRRPCARARAPGRREPPPPREPRRAPTAITPGHPVSRHLHPPHPFDGRPNRRPFNRSRFSPTGSCCRRGPHSPQQRHNRLAQPSRVARIRRSRFRRTASPEAAARSRLALAVLPADDSATLPRRCEATGVRRKPRGSSPRSRTSRGPVNMPASRTG